MSAPSVSPLAYVATFHSGAPVEKAITGDERVAQVNDMLKVCIIFLAIRFARYSQDMSSGSSCLAIWVVYALNGMVAASRCRSGCWHFFGV